MFFAMLNRLERSHNNLIVICKGEGNMQKSKTKLFLVANGLGRRI
jgi:hypothetical protein